MKSLELFCGSKSFTKVMEKGGFDCITVDNDPKFEPDICVDILEVKPNELGNFDVIWASPPCQCFSVASVYRYWELKNGEYYPKLDKVRESLELVRKTIEIITYVQPTYWFIENPRAMLRKIIDPLFKDNGIEHYVRRTVTYCQYGDERMKPTDIWTNLSSWYGRKCKNGDPCHVRAPRGSKQGTQRLSVEDRGKVPELLCKELLDSMLSGKKEISLEEFI